MLFYLLDVLIRDPAAFVALLPVYLVTIVLSLIVGLTVHEFAHALVAHLLGDDTARRAGRLSLNPIRHLDPYGTLMMVVVGLGWGKPVPVNPSMLPNARRSMAWVAAAGPASNLILAALLAVPIQLGWVDFRSPIFALPDSITSGDIVAAIFGFAIFYNILLGLFNLLPIFPLDGSKVVMGFAPLKLSISMANLERYGMLFLLMVFAIDYFSNANLLWHVIQPPANAIGTLFVGQRFL